MTTDGKKSPKVVWTKTELSFKSNFNIDLCRQNKVKDLQNSTALASLSKGSSSDISILAVAYLAFKMP